MHHVAIVHDIHNVVHLLLLILRILRLCFLWELTDEIVVVNHTLLLWLLLLLKHHALFEALLEWVLTSEHTTAVGTAKVETRGKVAWVQV